VVAPHLPLFHQGMHVNKSTCSQKGTSLALIWNICNPSHCKKNENVGTEQNIHIWIWYKIYSNTTFIQLVWHSASMYTHIMRQKTIRIQFWKNIYDPTWFSLPTILRDHSNTTGRLHDHYMLQDKMILWITCWDHSSSQGHVFNWLYTECDYFQTAALMNWVEYKKHKKLCSISSKTSFNICLLFLKNSVS